MSLRSTANFTVGVSLVNIPMKMYKATDGQKQSDMHQLCPTDKVRIQQKNICPICEKTIPFEDLLRGVEVETGKWLVFSKEELKALDMAKSERMEVLEFVDEDAIDTIYLEDSIYFLGPGLGFESAYATFRDGLFGKYAICDFVKSGHDHRVVLRAFDKAIEMRYLRPHAEVRVPNDIPNYDDIPEVGNPKHAKMMTQLVSQMLSETFDATAIVDGHAINKQKMIRAKIAGGDVEFTPDAPVKAATSDLMAALTASIAKSKAKSPKAKTTPAIRRKGRKVA